MRAVLHFLSEYLIMVVGLVAAGLCIPVVVKLGQLMRSSNFWFAALILFILVFLTANIITGFSLFTPPDGPLPYWAR